MNEQQLQLIVSKGPEPGKVIDLTSVAMTIGRDPMSEITIYDPEVSRRHARLVATRSGYQIQDLGSTNGTFVDGVRLGGDPVDLQPGQVITIGGGVALIYQVSTAAEDSSSAMPGEEESELVPPHIAAEPEPVSDTIVDSEYNASATLFSEEGEAENGGVDEMEMGDLAADPSDDSSTSAPIPETPHDEEQFSEEDADQVESYEASDFSDPVVIPHEGEPAPEEQSDQRSNYRRLSLIVATVLLVLVCCCCGFLLFFYYIGGDWLLRQMGLLP